LTAAIDAFERVVDVGLQSRHRRYARGRFAVSEHRKSETALLEQLGDVRQVRANLFKTRSVFRFVGDNLDRATVFRKPEMMSRLLVTKTHRAVTTRVNAVKTCVLLVVV